jgi:hypothetical protein
MRIIGAKNKQDLTRGDEEALIRAVYESTSLHNIKNIRFIRSILENLFIFREDQYDLLMRRIKKEFDKGRISED